MEVRPMSDLIYRETHPERSAADSDDNTAQWNRWFGEGFRNHAAVLREELIEAVGDPPDRKPVIGRESRRQGATATFRSFKISANPVTSINCVTRCVTNFGTARS